MDFALTPRIVAATPLYGGLRASAYLPKTMGQDWVSLVREFRRSRSLLKERLHTLLA